MDANDSPINEERKKIFGDWTRLVFNYKKDAFGRFYKWQAVWSRFTTRYVLKISDVDVHTFGGIGHVFREGHVFEC